MKCKQECAQILCMVKVSSLCLEVFKDVLYFPFSGKFLFWKDSY